MDIDAFDEFLLWTNVLLEYYGAAGGLYALVHSGSRHLGKEVAEYYMREGQKVLDGKGVHLPYELTYLEGDLMEDYLHDMRLVQEFAGLNRAAMLDELLRG